MYLLGVDGVFELTNSVVAIRVELSVEAGVGAVGVPVNPGELSGENVLLTKLVVAIRVELSVEAGVGAVGVPVNPGELSGAFADISLSNCEKVSLVMTRTIYNKNTKII